MSCASASSKEQEGRNREEEKRYLVGVDVVSGHRVVDGKLDASRLRRPAFHLALVQRPQPAGSRQGTPVHATDTGLRTYRGRRSRSQARTGEHSGRQSCLPPRTGTGTEAGPRFPAERSRGSASLPHRAATAAPTQSSPRGCSPIARISEHIYPGIFDEEGSSSSNTTTTTTTPTISEKI